MNSSVPSIGQGRLACAIGLTFALLLVSSSSALALTVRQIGVKANDILYEKVSGKLYVSVPGDASTYANSVVVIDPATGTIENSVWVGHEPNKLAASDDGQYLYVGTDGDGAIRRVTLATLTAGLQFGVSSDSLSGSNCAMEIAVLPGRPGSIAVVRGPVGSMAATGVSIYDEGVQRPLTITGWYGPSALAFGDNAEQLYGIDAGTSGDVFFRMAVSASGVTIVDRISGLIGGNARRIYYVNGRVYASTGVVLDPVHRVRLGCFPLPPSSFYFRDVAVDAIQGVAFGLADRVSGLAGNKTPVSAYGIDTYRYQWTAAVSDDSAPGSWSNRLVRWPGGIALRADYSKALFIVDFASSHRLTLSTSGTGRGTAVAAALSMACGADCARLVPEGTSVTLSATEQAGSSFVRWDGDADCADGVVTMAGGRSCVAVFRARTTGLGTRIGLAARDLAYSNATGKIYASIPGTNPIRGNTITEIDPTTGDLGASLWVGSEPDVLRLSEDGLTLYVGLDGAGAIRRVSVATMSALEEFSIGAGWAGYWPSEFQVLPGDPDSLAVVRSVRDSAEDDGVAIYTSGVMRPVTTSAGYPLYAAKSLAFSASPARLYGFDNATTGSAIYRMDVDRGGVTIVDATPRLVEASRARIHFNGGHILVDGGAVIDPEPPRLVRALPQIGLLEPDPISNEVYAVAEMPNGTVAVRRHDPSTFDVLAAATLSGSLKVFGSLCVAGLGRTAFRVGDTTAGSDSVVLYSFGEPVTQTIRISSSSPDAGIQIGVSPADSSTAADGFTPFERTFAAGTTVVLSAPAEAGGRVFRRWYRNGVLLTSNRTASVSVTESDDFVAHYVAPPPIVTSVTPSAGAPLTPVIVSGTHFVAGACVWFGSQCSPSVSVIDSSRIRAQTPAGTYGSSVTVTVVNPDGQSGSLAYAFRYVRAPGPFKKVEPAQGASGSDGVTTLRWASSSGAQGYEYCIDSTLNETCDGEWLSIGATQQVLTGPFSALTTYEWQVRAVNADGATEADDGWWHFTVAPDSGCVPGTTSVLARPTGAGLQGMWQATGVSVVAGRPLSLIVASGQTWSRTGVAWSADGNALDVTHGQNTPLAGAPRLSLVARIGESGTPFRVGRAYRAPATSSGELFLAPNDDWYLTWNNSGALPVTVCPGETPCSAQVTASVPASATPGVPVQFSTTTTTAVSCGGPVTYDWDFGDGSLHSSAQNPTHTYAAGSFTWTLTFRAGSASATRTGTTVVRLAGAPVCTSSSVRAVPSAPGLDGMWQPTGAMMDAGQSVAIAAAGAWTMGSGAVTADGAAARSLQGSNCPLAGAPEGALIGRIGQTGAPFLIGTSKSWTGTANGELFLAPNDNWYTLWDNAGTLNVSTCVSDGGRCSYSLAPTGGPIMPAIAGSGSFIVTSGTACAWAAVSDSAWLHITQGSGPGSGTVNFTVDANTGDQRTGTITVGDQVFRVAQAAGGMVSCTAVTVAAIPTAPGLDGMWQATGVTIAAGETVTIAAVGTWSMGAGAVSASGDASATMAGTNCPLAGAAEGALIGRVGRTGPPFAVGASKTLTSTTSGALYLAPNDNWYLLWNNAGTLSVNICR